MTPFGNKHFSYNFGILALTLFLVLTSIAMLVYPGGTNVDHSTEGYLFAKNFFSDLGRYLSFNGETKFASMVLFMTALTAASLATIIYFMSAPNLFNGLNRKIAIAGSIPGVFSGLCFLGVAFTPWDIYLGIHGFFVKAAFSSFLLTSFFYAAVVFRSQKLSNIYGWVFLSFSFILAGYLYLIFFGPSAKTPDGLLIQAVGQKIIVYAQVLCMLLQLIGAKKIVNGDQLPAD